MLEERNRILRMFYALSTAKLPLRSKELAQYAGISERTVKNDMLELKDCVMRSGGMLKAKRGTGYWLEVVDEQLYQNICEQLDIRFQSQSYYKSKAENISRANELIRCLIVQHEFVKLDHLADELFLSRSTIKHELREVRLLLSSFGLSLISKPGYGVCIQGNEFAKRICMMELYEVHFHKAIHISQSDAYMQYFYAEPKIKEKIRYVYLQVMRNTHIRITDSFINRMVKYLIMQRHRCSNENTISFSKEDKKLLAQFDEYKLAFDIVDALQRECGYTSFHDENEVLAIELMLLMWVDLQSSDDMKNRYAPFYDDAMTLSNHIKCYLDEKWKIKQIHIEQFKASLISAFIPILIQIHFQTSAFEVIGVWVSNNAIHTSPICVILAKSIKEEIENLYSIKLADYLVNMIAIRLYDNLDHITFHYEPRRLLICSRNGMQASNIIRRKLLRSFSSELFASIDVFDLYEIRKLNQNDYDYLLLNFPAYSYQYEIPYMEFSQIPSRKQVQSFQEDVVLKGYEIMDIYESFHFDANFYYPEFDYEYRDTFLNLLCYKNACSPQSITAMYQSLQKLDDHCVKNGVAVLMVEHSYTTRNCFEIYKCFKSGLWIRKQVQYIIFISVELDDEMKKLRFLEYVTHECVENTKNIEQLLQAKDLKGMIDIVGHSLLAG